LAFSFKLATAEGREAGRGREMQVSRIMEGSRTSTYMAETEEEEKKDLVFLEESQKTSKLYLNAFVHKLLFIRPQKRLPLKSFGIKWK
jgi:hypothetical protein